MNLLSNIGLTICGTIFLLFIIFGYLRSKKFKTYESILFRIMLWSILLASLIEIVFGIIAINASELYNVQNILVKVYIFITMLWLNSLTIYLIVRSNQELFKDKKYKIISIVILVLLTIGPFIFKNVTGKIPLLDENNIIGSINAVYGHPTHFCMIPVLISIILLLFTSLKHMDKAVKIPFFSVLIVLIGEVVLSLLVKTELNELTFVFILLTIVIYLTSESVNIKLIKEINESKAESEIALDGQNEFISSMSHDIRTPLGAIIGISEVLLHDNELTLTKAKEELETVKDASIKLSELLNNLIDISKINDGQNEISKSTIAVKSLTEYIDSLMKPKVAKVNTTLSYAVNERMSSTIEGDFEKISKAISLITNAIISKTENGSININYSGEVSGEIYNFKTDIECMNCKLTIEDLNIDFGTYMSMYTDKINTIDSEKLGIIIAKYFVELLNGSINLLTDETGKIVCSITLPVSLGRGE